MFYVDNPNLLVISDSPLNSIIQKETNNYPYKFYISDKNVGKKDLFIQINTFGSDSNNFTFIFKRTNQEIEYRSYKDFQNNHIEMDNCLLPKYIAYSTQYLYNEFIYYNVTFGEISVNYTNAITANDTNFEFNFEGSINLLQNLYYSSSSFVLLKFECTIPGQLEYYFLDNYKWVDFQYGRRMMIIDRSSTTSVHVAFPNKYGALSAYVPQYGANVHQVLTYWYSGHFYTFGATESFTYYLEGSPNTPLILTGHICLDNTFRIDTNIEWKSKDESEELVLNETIVYFFLPSFKTNWTYIEVTIETDSEFDSHFGYYIEHVWKYPEYFPISQNHHQANTKKITFKKSLCLFTNSLRTILFCFVFQ